MKHQPTVLLVEDENTDAFLMARAFQKAKLNSKLVRVNDGDRAVSYLGGEEPYGDRTMYPVPAILLLDIKLPKRSGFEVIEWVRKQNNTLRRMPVVMYSSSDLTTDVNRAYELGANGYLHKPKTIQELIEMVALFEEYWFRRSETPEV